MGIPLTILGTTRVNYGDEDDSEWEMVVNKKTGEEEEKKTMYGSPITNSFAQAFKRSCALFGMGLDMYDKSARTAPAPNRAAAPAPHPSAPPYRNAEQGDPEPEHNRPAPPAQKAVPVPKCAKCGGAMWDNRPKKASGEYKATSPDFACKDKNCKHAEWIKDDPTPNTPATSAVLLEDALNRAAAVGAITVPQSARVEEVLATGNADEMATALAWLKSQMDKRALAGSGS